MIRYLEAVDFIKSEEGLKVLMSRYKEVFENLDIFDTNFQEGLVNSSPEELDLTLMQSTGYFSALMSIFGAFEAYKVNKGGMKTLNEQERNIYELVKCYMEKSDRMILVCQTLRKAITKEWSRASA